jgi:hypothetical protein
MSTFGIAVPPTTDTYSYAAIADGDPFPGATWHVEQCYLWNTIQEAGTVSAATYTPTASITGQNTNTRLLEFVNDTSATVLATLQMNAGVNATAGVPIALAVSGSVAVGDHVYWRTTKVGTGLADPGGHAYIEYA